MTPTSRHVRPRTPSSAVLVQALFVFGALGTGVIGALAVWLTPKSSARKAESSSAESDPPEEPPREA